MSSCTATQPLANGRARYTQNTAQKLTYGAMRNSSRSAAGGNDVFLAQQLDAVGRRLQPAEPAAHPRRAQPVLNPAGHLPLQPDEHQPPTATTRISAMTSADQVGQPRRHVLAKEFGHASAVLGGNQDREYGTTSSIYKLSGRVITISSLALESGRIVTIECCIAHEGSHT